MADDRNFRSAYYEKVGYKGVDEKKNLESLLQNVSLIRSNNHVNKQLTLNLPNYFINRTTEMIEWN